MTDEIDDTLNENYELLCPEELSGLNLKAGHGYPTLFEPSIYTFAEKLRIACSILYRSKNALKVAPAVFEFMAKTIEDEFKTPFSNITKILGMNKNIILLQYYDPSYVIEFKTSRKEQKIRVIALEKPEKNCLPRRGYFSMYGYDNKLDRIYCNRFYSIF